MRFRRHHNNKGTRRIKNGTTTRQLERMAKRIFSRRAKKVGGSIIIKEKGES